ncbi:hypothetical protein [Labrys monachus]|uniref:Uncharacterized protein n=1 Tax=Labrys monachus TaxID=217067 RepID=A0ABU0FHP3_9HYPH|nr:hypothetical protein [Labrys monachus]MDQ0394026.1 hypothetical protein [Labrys monachus]
MTIGFFSLAACDYWIGDAAATMPDQGSWQVLPMRAFLTNRDVRVEGMQLCTLARCGYDAALERFTATGEEAAALERALAQPRQLAAAIARPARPGSKTPPPQVVAENFGNGAWSGVHLAMTGGAKSRHVEGYAVSRRGPAGTTFIVLIAADAAVSKRLIIAATR